MRRLAGNSQSACSVTSRIALSDLISSGTCLRPAEAVAIVGEAGVGKSRLVYEFIQSQDLHGWRVLEGDALSYGRATSYLAVIDLPAIACTRRALSDGSKSLAVVSSPWPSSAIDAVGLSFIQVASLAEPQR